MAKLLYGATLRLVGLAENLVALLPYFGRHDRVKLGGETKQIGKILALLCRNGVYTAKLFSNGFRSRGCKVISMTGAEHIPF
jgi:hypothetical protein